MSTLNERKILENKKLKYEPTILYQDEDIVAINKPAGLIVHRDGRTEEPALTDWIEEHFPEMKKVGEPLITQGKEIDRPGIVHRIDRDTSGVLLLARTQKAYLFLKRQFQARGVRKTYRAFVYGNIKLDHGLIQKPIGKSKSNFRQFDTRGMRGEEREAITVYDVLKRGMGFSYISVYPKTGRTHQIRVHLKSLGHSVVGDELYAKERKPILGFTRLALHAFSIECKKPSGERLFVEAPLPPDFLAALGNI